MKQINIHVNRAADVMSVAKADHTESPSGCFMVQSSDDVIPDWYLRIMWQR